MSLVIVLVLPVLSGEKQLKKASGLIKGARLVYLVYCLEASPVEQDYRQTKSFLTAPVTFKKYSNNSRNQNTWLFARVQHSK